MRLLLLLMLAVMASTGRVSATTSVAPPQDIDAYAQRVLHNFMMPGLAPRIEEGGQAILTRRQDLNLKRVLP